MNMLSNLEHWDDVLKNNKNIPRTYNLGQYNIKKFHCLFNKFIDSKKEKILFEYGCGSSAWLPYFKTYFSCKVSGIDYSDYGVKFAQENINYFGASTDEIIFHGDFTDNNINLPMSDIIFSYGVLEHFENPDKIIKSFKKNLNDNGIIISIIPNLNGIYGLINKLFLPNLFKIHNVISSQEFNNYHKVNSFNSIFSGYYGTFYLPVIAIENIEKFIEKGSILYKIFIKLFYLINRFINTLFDIFHLNFNCKYLSPYIVYIGELNCGDYK